MQWNRIANLTGTGKGGGKILLPIFLAAILVTPAVAAPKPHIISFGKWAQVDWTAGQRGTKSQRRSRFAR
jgi:hypothetical protein